MYRDGYYFTAMIMIPLYKNPIWWIHDYPEDIQEEYFKTHERIPTSPLSPKVALKKGFALIFVRRHPTDKYIILDDEISIFEKGKDTDHIYVINNTTGFSESD